MSLTVKPALSFFRLFVLQFVADYILYYRIRFFYFAVLLLVLNERKKKKRKEREREKEVARFNHVFFP